MKISNLELVTTQGQVIIQEWAELIFVDRNTIQLTINDSDLPIEYEPEDIESISFMPVH